MYNVHFQVQDTAGVQKLHAVFTDWHWMERVVALERWHQGFATLNTLLLTEYRGDTSPTFLTFICRSKKTLRHWDTETSETLDSANLSVVVWYVHWYTFMYKILHVQKLQSSLTDSDIVWSFETSYCTMKEVSMFQKDFRLQLTLCMPSVFRRKSASNRVWSLAVRCLVDTWRRRRCNDMRGLVHFHVQETAGT